MDRRPRRTRDVFFLPVEGFTLYYLSKTHRIISCQTTRERPAAESKAAREGEAAHDATAPSPSAAPPSADGPPSPGRSFPRFRRGADEKKASPSADKD